MTLLFLISIVLLTWAGLRTPAIQTILTQKYIATLSDKTGTSIHVGKIRYRMNKDLLIRDFLILDQQNDTLLYFDKAVFHVLNLNLKNHQVDLSKVKINHLVSRVKQVDEASYNYTFLLDSLQQDEPKAFDWNLSCLLVNLKSSEISFTPYRKSTLEVKDIHLQARSLQYSPEKAALTLPTLSFHTNSDLQLKSLSATFQKLNEQIIVRDFALASEHSKINIDSAFYQPDYLIKNNFFADLYFSESQIHPSEFKQWESHLALVQDDILLAGHFRFSDSNLSGKNMKLSLSNLATIDAEFQIPYTEKDKQISINIKEAFADLKGIQSRYQALMDTFHIQVPPLINHIDQISYSGLVKGSKDQLINKGTLTSNLGIFNLNTQVEKDKDAFQIQGNVAATPLYLNDLLPDSTMGQISLNLATEGSYSKKNGLNINLNGGLHDIHYKEQHFDSIALRGHFTEKSFTGKVVSYDQRLRFDLNGSFLFDSLPQYHFESNIYTADLHALGLSHIPENTDLSFNLDANFQGTNYKNFEGKLNISDIFYFYDSSYFATDTIQLVSTQTYGKRDISLQSEFLEAKLQGEINFPQLFAGIKNYGAQFIPSNISPATITDSTSNFQFVIKAEYPQPITSLFFPNYEISSGSYIEGYYNAKAKNFWSRINVDEFKHKDKTIDNFELFIHNQQDVLKVELLSDAIHYTPSNVLNNLEILAEIKNDTINSNLIWSNWLQHTYSGNIRTQTVLSKENNIQRTAINIKQSNIVIHDTLWLLANSSIVFDTSGILFNNIQLLNERSLFALNGKYSDNPQDSINLLVENFNMNYVNAILKKERLVFGGSLNGESKIKDLAGEMKINFDFAVDNFTLNDKFFGNTNLKSVWNSSDKNLAISGFTHEETDTTFQFNGFISPTQKNIDCDIAFNQFSLSFLEAWLNPTLQNIRGNGTGHIHLFGDFPTPNWEGELYTEFNNVTIKPTQVGYKFSDTIQFRQNKILFNHATLYDKDSNQADFHGIVTHERFKDFTLDLQINTDKILAINTNYTHHPKYYGTGYANGIISLKGLVADVEIDIVATTLKNTLFTIPLEGKGDIQDNDFLVFQTPDVLVTDMQNNDVANSRPKANTKIRMDLTVTPDAEIQIMFDPQYGDYLRASGNAELTMEAQGTDFFMYGDYMIYNGDFMFTLQNVINKKLEIEQGSMVSWSGKAGEAAIDIDAVYKIRRVSLKDLTTSADDEGVKIPVNCHLIMSNTLQEPVIRFSVDVPTTTNNEVVEQINSLPDEEINKQVVSLLLLNKFSPLPGVIQSEDQNNTSTFGATTASELLSNQLSSWLSQISNDVQMGVMYRPGDEVSQQEFEFALSTSVWNDRLSINGNLGINSNEELVNQNMQYTTDFQVELKLNKKGNIRLTAFNKVNNDYIYNDNAAYTQGGGIFFTDEFDTFDELLQKMFHKSVATKPEEVEFEVESNQL